MTKEEILNNEHHKLVDDRGFPLGSEELIFVYKPAAISAMDEYAKQQAIAFLKRHIEFSDPKMYETMYAHFIDNQFIEQQNKDNDNKNRLLDN